MATREMATAPVTSTRGRRLRRLGSFGVIGAAMALAACAPPPVATPPPATYPNTTTVDISYSCAGVGFASGIGTVPTQVITATIGYPDAIAEGSSIDISVTLGTFALAAAPPEVNLNLAGLSGIASLSSTNGTVGNAVGTPVYFTGNGVTATIPAATVAVTAGTGSSMDITVGGVNMLVGSTGFTCVPTAPTAGGGTVNLPLVP